MNQTGNILIVEDDRKIRYYIKNILTASGHTTLEAATASEALSAADVRHPDLILLDLGLPDADGLDVIRRIRLESEVPIIVVSARDHEKDKVIALDIGANDYVTKPFGPEELLARIRAALRHSRSGKPSAPSVFRHSGLVVDSDKRTVFLKGQPVHLTQTEYKVLLLLCQNSGKVLTYDFILNSVWGSANYDAQVLRVNMANIRRKIESDPTMPEFIKTEMGVGYRMAEMTTE